MKESIFVKLQAASPSRLNSFISIFKGFTKSVSYLALRFSKLGTTVFKKYLLHSEHTTSLCNVMRHLYDDKTSYRQL